MDVNHFIEIEKHRAGAYNLFSSLMCEPEPEISSNKDLFNYLGSYLDYLMPDNSNHIKDALKESLNVTQQQLQIEYARLFVGPFAVPAQPYSSLHLGESIVMGDATVWVEKFYKSVGVEFDYDIKDLPDHAVVESEFMYYLIFNEISALEEGDYDRAKMFWEKQKTFTSEHYNIWMPKLCTKVIDNSELDYFKIIFQNLDSFISSSEIPDFPNNFE